MIGDPETYDHEMHNHMMSDHEDQVPLRIDFQEVFKDDAVHAYVNGEEVFGKTGVTTNWSVGLADSVEVMVPRDQVEVRVDLPTRNLSRTVDFYPSEPVYLVVKVSQDMIDIDISKQQRTYY
jgi:hypothetical protein